jgi:hypothetical protein
MTNANNDVRELEDLLTELEGQGALPVGPYSDEDDAVTQLMDAPLGEQEWMVQITPHDRRMMSTDQLLSELQTGVLVQRDMLVWRSGMGDWAPIVSIDELRSVLPASVLPASVLPASALPVMEPPAPRPLPPPPAPLPPRLGSNVNASPGPLSSPRAPMPVPASVPFAMPKPVAPAADVLPPPPAMPLSSSPYASPPAPTPDLPSGLPALNSAFNGSAPDFKSTAISPGAPPPPAVARVNTARPVAVDFSEMEPRRGTPMRIIIGSGIAALAMIVGTVYGLSAGGVFESSAEVSAEHSAPASTSKPSSAPAAAPVAAKPSTPAPPPAPAPKAEEPMTQTVSAKESEPVAVTPAVAADPEEKHEEKPSKLKDSDKEERAEASSDEVSSTKSEGKKASRRMKRSSASSEEKEEKKERAKAEPRRSKPRAAVAVAAEEPRAEDAEPKEAAGSTFNKQAATAALDDAAAKAKNCRPQGGPSGTGKVQVRYEPNGKVGAVSILTPSFANTTTGDCVVMVFRRANVPAFTGAPAVVLNKNFDIPAN